MGDVEASQARRHLANALVPGVSQDLALQEFTKAIELDPTFAEAYAKRALFDLFGGLLTLPTYDDLADAEKAIQLNPALVDAYFVRGWMFSEYTFSGSTDVEKRKRAIEDLKKVLELSPSFSVILADRDVVTGKRRVIGPKEIRQKISVLEIQIQKRTMKELVEALVNATSIEQRWLVVGILTPHVGPSHEIVADEEGINMLIEALGSQDSEICRAAAYVLRFWPDERAFKPLLRCVGVYGEKGMWVPQHADLALDSVEEKIGKLSTVNELYTQALADQHPAIRETAAKRFPTRPKIHITWLDREGKPLGYARNREHIRRDGVTKDTKPSILIDRIARSLNLPTKTSKGQKIEYLIQTEDDRALDLNETFEDNFKKLGIDNLSANLRIVPRAQRKFWTHGLLKRARHTR
jgi:tetratricopeptide (TPR) repeat protein